MYFRDLVKNRILITGANGMLGQRVLDFYSHPENLELLSISVEEKPVLDSVDYLQCDITERDKKSCL